jgi:hypothetical protein
MSGSGCPSRWVGHQATARRNAEVVSARETALSRFTVLAQEVRETLEALCQHADDHFGVDPESVSWTTVGDVARIKEALADVLAIARGDQNR